MYISKFAYREEDAWGTGSLTWYINGAIVDLKRSVDIRGWFADDCMNCRTKKHQGECAARQFL